MKTFVVQDPTKGQIVYQDRKRYLWLASLFYPMAAFSGIALYLAFGSEAWLVMPLVMTYGGASFFDWWFGEDKHNPPEEIVPALEDDTYYRWLPLLTVPMHIAVLLVMAAFVGTHDLSIPALAVVALSAGLVSGLGINTAHELGHKKTQFERWMARIVLAVPAYGHFCVEHNRGHHRHVATPNDPASSRLGENIYRFAMREIPGCFKRGWAVEAERLQRLGKSAWHYENEVLQSYALTAVFQFALIAAFGWIMLPFLAIHNFFAWWQLTSANYIEHYGLLRKQNVNGSFEHCQPWHSWNADYFASNMLLYQLERHSDHHAHPTRRYQSLRSFPNLPTLPNGYIGMYLVALIPPLWYLVMDKRLLALPHINGDLSLVNIDPARRNEMLERYGSGAPLQAA